MFTVPGQVIHASTRRLVVQGADGIAFIADSRAAETQHNTESFMDLRENFKQHGLPLKQMPLIIQFNKRDIPGVLPVEALQEALSLEGYPYAEASALKGDGVMETFKLASQLTAKHLYARLKGKH